MMFHIFNRYGERTLEHAAHSTVEIIACLILVSVFSYLGNQWSSLTLRLGSPDQGGATLYRAQGHADGSQTWVIMIC